MPSTRSTTQTLGRQAPLLPITSPILEVLTQGQTTTYSIDGIRRMQILRDAQGAFPDSIGAIRIFDTDGITDHGEQIYRLEDEQYPGLDSFEVHTRIHGVEPEMSLIEHIPGMYSAIRAMMRSIIKPEWDGRICLDIYTQARQQL